jgi:hypothetical protein
MRSGRSPGVKRYPVARFPMASRESLSLEATTGRPAAMYS